MEMERVEDGDNMKRDGELIMCFFSLYVVLSHGL